MWPHNRKGNSNIHRRPLRFKKPYALTCLCSYILREGRVLRAGVSHLCFSLLQEGLKPLLSSPPLVVVAHYQDDVVPVELAHQIEPHVRLVGIGRDCPQKGQVDTLRSVRQKIEISILTLTVYDNLNWQ